MLVVKDHKKILLNLRDPDRVTTIVPGAKKVALKDGGAVVAVKHTEDAVRLLRNLGFDAPGPVLSYYDFPGTHKPFVHQRATVEFLTMHPRAFCLNGMGSGKTLSVLWAFDYLRKQGTVDWMLVISPLSTLERAWGDEIYRNFFDMTFAVVHGTRDRRHKLLDSKFDAYIINHDGIKSDSTLECISRIPGKGLIVVDEIAEFSNAQTDRWKYLNKLINPKVNGATNPRPWVWGLTGTPIPQAPTDAWAQVKLLAPSRVPGYFGRFREQVMQPISRFKWAPRPGALDVVRDLMQPSIRFSREECIDLPPVTYATRMAPLEPEQKKAYDDMLRSMKATIDGEPITAVNAAVKINKLIQICCGKVYGDSDEIAVPATARVELTKEIIRESEGKVIVFAPFTAALYALADELRKDFTVEVVSGKTSKAERDEIFKRFQQQVDPRVMVANAGTMSHGLSFTAANTIVWFAPGNSNRIRMQADERMARPGQTRNMLIVNLASTKLELQRYNANEERAALQDILLEAVQSVK